MPHRILSFMFILRFAISYLVYNITVLFSFHTLGDKFLTVGKSTNSLYLDTKTYELDGRGVNNNIDPHSYFQHKGIQVSYPYKEYIKGHKQRTLDCITSMAFLLSASLIPGEG